MAVSFVAVSHHFGYGLLDVDAMVSLAQNWTSVPEQHRCEILARLPSRYARVSLKQLGRAVDEMSLEQYNLPPTP